MNVRLFEQVSVATPYSMVTEADRTAAAGDPLDWMFSRKLTSRNVMGAVDMGFFNTPTVISQIQAGKLKPLGVTSLAGKPLA